MKKLMVLCAIGGLVAMFGTSLVADTKIVRIPRPLGVAAEGYIPAQEQLELNDDETLTVSTFAELIREKQQQGLAFIMARVLTRTNEGLNVHYFDAHSLNRLYGQYPFSVAQQVNGKIDPINRAPIFYIQYFTISTINAPAFEYLCSDYEILTNAQDNLYKQIFYANQNDNRQLQLRSQIFLAQRYLLGNGVEKNYATARQYFEQIANQNVNPGAAAGAKHCLGEIYYKGNGVEKNYETARQYFEQAANQNVNPGAAAIAKYNLGTIYYEGNGVDQDYATARQYFEQAANQNVNPGIAARAKYNLGTIYYEGKGVDQDYARARNWYQQVIDSQNIDEADKNRARAKIAEIDRLEAAQASGVKREGEVAEEKNVKRQKMNKENDNNNNN